MLRDELFLFESWEPSKYKHRECAAVKMLLLTFKSLPVRWCTSSLTFNNYTLCPHCIYVFCVYLRTNGDLCHLQRKLIGFYNPDEKCLQRGTDLFFKYSGLRFVCKGLIIMAN